MIAHGPGTATTSIPAPIAARTSGAPGSLTVGVPASLTSATLAPALRRSMMRGTRSRSLCSCRDSIAPAGRWMPLACSSCAVCRVSSASSRSASRNRSRARAPRSPRFPIGVATRNSTPGRGPAIESIATLATRIPRGPMLHASLHGRQVRALLFAAAIAIGAASLSPPAARAATPDETAEGLARSGQHEAAAKAYERQAKHLFRAWDTRPSLLAAREYLLAGRNRRRRKDAGQDRRPRDRGRCRAACTDPG